MGRLSKKAIQEKKEAKIRYIISLAIQSLVGAVIFSLLLFIIIGAPSLLDINEYVQGNHMEFKVTLMMALPLSFLFTFACNIVRSYTLGEFNK